MATPTYINAVFSKSAEYIGTFFKRNNNLVNLKVNLPPKKDYTYRLTGSDSSTIDLKLVTRNGILEKIYSIEDDRQQDLSNNYIDSIKRKELIERVDVIDNDNKIIYFSERIFDNVVGGRKASVKKEVCGKLRCIYKIHGSRKEHLKYKGQLITVAEYKKLMNAKA